jgi:hypothetical protein
MAVLAYHDVVNGNWSAHGAENSALGTIHMNNLLEVASFKSECLVNGSNQPMHVSLSGFSSYFCSVRNTYSVPSYGSVASAQHVEPGAAFGPKCHLPKKEEALLES